MKLMVEVDEDDRTVLAMAALHADKGIFHSTLAAITKGLGQTEVRHTLARTANNITFLS